MLSSPRKSAFDSLFKEQTGFSRYLRKSLLTPQIARNHPKPPIFPRSVPTPPGANPLVAERAFPTSDYWGRTGVAGICRYFQQSADPLSHKTAKTSKGPFQLPGVSTRGGLGTRQFPKIRHCPEISQEFPLNSY